MSYRLKKVRSSDTSSQQITKFVFIKDERRIFDVTLDRMGRALKVVSCLDAATRPVRANEEDMVAFEDGLLRAYETKNPHFDVSSIQSLQSETIGPGMTTRTLIQGRFGNVVLTINGMLQRSIPTSVIHAMDDLTITPEFTRPRSIICPGVLKFMSPLYARREPAKMDYSGCDIVTRHLLITGSRVRLGAAEMSSCTIQFSDAALTLPEHLQYLSISSSVLRVPHQMERLTVDRNVNIYEVSVSTAEDTASFVKHIDADAVSLRKLSQRFLSELTVSARKFYPNVDRDKNQLLPYVLEHVHNRRALEIDNTVRASFEHPISQVP